MQPLKGRLRRSGDGEVRADPAPSRLKYRLQRWMLTPGIRFGLRIGVPFCLIFAAGSAYLADETRRAALQGLVSDARAAIEERPEFMVNVMAVDGAGPSVAQDIREVVPAEFPVSSFDLDLEQIRDVITGLDPVKSASVRIRPGGILQVDVEERKPALIWRSREGLALLDEQGIHVAELGRRSLHPELPLIAGKGAEKQAAQALQLFAAAKPLGPRLRGLVRVGERRWDVVLDRKQRIMLPAEQPVRALERVLAVSEVQDLLERDVAAVDMRLAGRPTVRMTENSVENWWRIRQLNGGGQ
ncbi:cell division protein FtsQ/DivIB [Leisingera methylohalidivorans]|uniref:Cell division protein FtsQ n=1 Tax=Leisingera methylohalidivorans DSM 14336 TaxID=999552 RepID=V9VVK0_9RHOB|nr:cell division protein FtsQ/DivIB [Leisingera methylohalidivorans]AHD01390.1 cell division protein FtsQ [Leisingera methylohalidivorans DSM 14336]